jgi:aryl-alcohol dehydrogenase-like predicted oxidoreductase
VDAAIIGPRNLSHLTAALEGVTIALSSSDRAQLARLFDRSLG